MKRSIIFFVLLAAIASCWFFLKPVGSDTADEGPAIDYTVDNNWWSITFMSEGTEMPEALAYLPPPPTEGDGRLYYDSLRYEWGKTMRNTPRGDTAVMDVKSDPEYFMKRFGEVMGIEMTPQTHPKTFYLMAGTLNDIRSSIQSAKKTYARPRPYQYFGESTPVPEEEEQDDYTSFPSGHSVRGWAMGVLFSTLCPEHEVEIIRVAYEIGQSRVIVGFHYQSDVDASRLAASAGMARLSAVPDFEKAMAEAKEEIYSQLKK